MCKGSSFSVVIDMGEQPLVNSLVSVNDLANDTAGTEVWPLVVERCNDCGLVQIVDIVDANKIYRDEDYLYFSGDMPNLSEYFKDYAEYLKENFITKEGELVVEIGSNDGIMLEHLKDKATVLGVDPASNVVSRALRRGIPTISDFFSARLAKSIERDWGKAKVIYGNNCIAHLNNLYDLMDGVNILMPHNGTFAVECNYWGGMVKNKNYSLIYHDHFSYFSLLDWVDFLERNQEVWGMEVFDAWVTPAQGGSLRLFIGRIGEHEISDRFVDLVNEEKDTKLNSQETCDQFREDALDRAHALAWKVKSAVEKGKKVAGYGAAAKGFSILSLAGLMDKKYIQYFVDDSPAKQDKFTPVSFIPVMSRELAARSLPDVFVITAPNYADVIIEKEKAAGFKGEFILP